MRSTRHFQATAAALFGVLAGTGMAVAQAPTAAEYQEIVTTLQEQNQTLQRSLTQANRAEKEASGQLSQVREKLAVLGKNVFDGGNDRAIQIASDLELERERNAALESAVAHLASAVSDYIRLAVVSDPDSRVRVETSLRELDAVLGLRQKPRPDVRAGSLQQARVVSIDQESGMLVFNLGEGQGAKIGMTFRLARGQQPYGTAIIADVRKAVAGAFVDHLDNVTESPRMGDLAILETQAQ